MSAADDQDTLNRAIEALRQPVELSPGLDHRVMSQVRAHRPTARRAWLPPAVLRLAAAVVLLLGGWLLLRLSSTPGMTPGTTAVHFELSAPEAGRVALVGDFNDWDPAGTPLREESDGRWVLEVPLPPGRYHYTFVVDGSRWVADPSEPAALDDFGTPTSVITVARS